VSSALLNGLRTSARPGRLAEGLVKKVEKRGVGGGGSYLSVAAVPSREQHLQLHKLARPGELTPAQDPGADLEAVDVRVSHQQPQLLPEHHR